MTNWLDEPPYPWHLAAGRDLHKRLIEAYFEPVEVRTLVQKAKAPDWTGINWNTSISRVWVDILSRGAAEGALRTLLAFIVGQPALPQPTAEFIRAILDDREPATDAAPPGAQGQPLVAAVTREEALLFGDNLSESVGEIPELLASIERVMKARSAICRLLVKDGNGRTSLGTGTLLAGNRILTNHHVVFPEQKVASVVTAEFDYEQDARGQAIKSRRVSCDIGSIRSNGDDDWAVITVAEPPATAVAFDLGALHAAAKPDERAFILQHPAGKPKRLGFVRNKVASVDARRVYYLTDTEPGSSGSPVFNGDGQMIALHRAGGEPQKFPGLPPVKKNEGVRIDVIAAAVLA
jgi:V8-like Glu-specific endopeptidase